MALPSARSLRSSLALTVLVSFAALLVACASLGPAVPVAVTDVKSVAGKWRGIVYRTGSEPDYVEVTIREDGSYDLMSRQTYGTSRGRGTLVAKDGRLIIQGERGQGVATLTRSAAGDRVLLVEATMSDNSTLSAKLTPSR